MNLKIKTLTMTLSESYQRYLDSPKFHNAKRNTQRNNTQAWKRIEPIFGDMACADIKATHIRQFFEKLAETTPGAVRQTHATFGNAYKHYRQAMEDSGEPFVDALRYARVKIPEPKRKRLKLIPDELRWLWDLPRVHHDTRAVIRLQILTGMRVNEPCRLTLDHIHADGVLRLPGTKNGEPLVLPLVLSPIGGP